MNKRMTVRDIAGFCPERAVWKMLADVSACLQQSSCLVTVDTIMLDGDHFLTDGSLAPSDESESVWALGAAAFYMATGHAVFGEQGKAYQQAHPHVALPCMPKAFQMLTQPLHRCLCHDACQRITLLELTALAQQGFSECMQRERQILHVANKQTEPNNRLVDWWPEEMRE